MLQHNRHIHIVAPGAHFDALGALVHAYEQKGMHVTHESAADAFPDRHDLLHIAETCDAILLSVDGRYSPRSICDGPVVTASDGRIVPVGILTARTEMQRQKFAESAARVHSEYTGAPALAILSQRHPRYVQVAARVEEILSKAGGNPIRTYRWRSDAVVREEMIGGLSSGIGAALYLGHGRPNGWVGYYGLRAHHFTVAKPNPLGVMLSLCCQTASRYRTGYAFAERLVFQGSAAACLAAVSPTKFTDNTRWAVRLTQAMQNAASDLYSLLKQSIPPSDDATLPYRIIGDPFAPILCSPGAVSFSNSIKIYA